MASFDESLRALHGTAGIVEFLDITSPDGTWSRHITPYYIAAGFTTYGGVDYTCFPYASVGWEMRATGTLPRPTLTVSNVIPEFHAEVVSKGDMVGYKARRYFTFENFLDGAVNAAPTEHSRYEIYYFEQKLEHTETYISWQLASAIDQGNIVLPRRQYLKDKMPDDPAHPGVPVPIPGSVYSPGLTRVISR